ncbi:MAG: hypothetical protein GY845_35595 [Planctomycetes bacterium]|nr:hypothetical protein [Planctomycetota bacterium]
MSRRDNLKKLSIVEVVIVVLVCLFLLGIAAPAFQQIRIGASRITCNRNLSTIGKAMIIYANDYDDELPRAGGRNSMWSGGISNWMSDNRFGAYGLGADGSGGMATITSSFYLLVKYMEVSPKTFVCPGDEGATEFIPTGTGTEDRELIDFWDFGDLPSRHCSYSYHMPYGLYTLTTSSEPGMAVAADRNPWISSSAAKGKDSSLLSTYNPTGSREAIKVGNSIAHREEGQNVLFLDGHVSFEENPFCGLNDDNIYTYWDGGDIRRGGYPMPVICEPTDREDSFLVNEPTAYKTTTNKEAKNINSTDLKETSIAATLDCPMPEHKNVIWCSTFQIAWDRLKNDIIGEPVKVPEAEELAKRLNQAEASKTDLEEKSFYSAAGIVKDGIIEEILTEMKKRFPSEPEPDFSKLDSLSSDIKKETIVTYSLLDVELDFKKPFHNNDSKFNFKASNGKNKTVTSFGTSKKDWDAEVAEQVDILYYKHIEFPDKAYFVVDLCKYTEPYQVVLALLPRRDTLRETIDAVEQKISEFKKDPHYEQLRKLQPSKSSFVPSDSLIVPDTLYKLTHQYAELINKEIKNQNYWNYWFFIARQMINFSLSRTGVTVKSEARLAAPPPAGRMGAPPKRLHCNRPFLIYVKKRQGGTDPFFVMWVDNAELMQEFDSK